MEILLVMSAVAFIVAFMCLVLGATRNSREISSVAREIILSERAMRKSSDELSVRIADSYETDLEVINMVAKIILPPDLLKTFMRNANLNIRDKVVRHMAFNASQMRKGGLRRIN